MGEHQPRESHQSRLTTYLDPATLRAQDDGVIAMRWFLLCYFPLWTCIRLTWICISVRSGGILMQALLFGKVS